ncbi:4-diphosphocytidyl-2-C-methyl-D-erythritol kinase [Enhydrobacter aerosaccus]|uniref:4-diphosphocytidyl-2-C-methyl-D-erythritol kinase n=1 Tax=Enhydrobacter aerosaccus TaxID=225324 RepID=A0A1T4MZQ0_9HYPH|nr:4-diphosphocytidyl-2-C-methyl-D-erythritol kinase [Enhydrobacter aerosaccus]
MHVEAAPAKVNLWLNVVGRRADGYHLLDSLVAFSDLADTLEIRAADDLRLTIEGLGAETLSAEPDNLVLKAARGLADAVGRKPQVAFRLVKRIPMAAGLGGGSADAAAALRGLVRFWRLGLPQADLLTLATRLGADVPMCLLGKPSIARGIGEELEAAPALPRCGVLLVNPGAVLPTPAVFAARRGPFSPVQPIEAWQDLPALVEALAARGNDLTDGAISLQPVVGEVLATLRRSPGVRYAAMSGSGATCFALFDDVAGARSAAASLPPQWWRHAGGFA